MTPTLAGRVQTRLFLTVVIGGLWTAVLTPFLRVPGSLVDRYLVTGSILLLVLLLGLLWEFVYHILQQFRWEKDWPILLALLTGISEGLFAWWVVDAGLVPTLIGVELGTFVLHFVTTWLITWLFLVGPIRVLFMRWRFTGGRIF